ncbi:MAG: response regulator transcription factor [Balneolaceae bacterium]|nr:response regulator transcription factor [Balneolaceae bacterium]
MAGFFKNINGKRMREIAEKMNISVQTIHTYKKQSA